MAISCVRSPLGAKSRHRFRRNSEHNHRKPPAEIGIRIAMGASAARITGLMLRYGLLPVICGMAVGWSGALAISRLFSAMLFDVGPLDLPTWILVSSAMLAVACIASYLPARRAGRVDPIVALRAE
jgi:ABC-type antimicrobial peptide transport system permease subunit